MEEIMMSLSAASILLNNQQDIATHWTISPFVTLACVGFATMHAINPMIQNIPDFFYSSMFWDITYSSKDSWSSQVWGRCYSIEGFLEVDILVMLIQYCIWNVCFHGWGIVYFCGVVKRMILPKFVAIIRILDILMYQKEFEYSS